MRMRDNEQHSVPREAEPIPYWTPGRKGSFLGAGGTALLALLFLWLGWVRPFWM
ncbi:hypothetical protein [Mesorhizobium sp. J428]|uniref:hypothetical protein n=1 Tax=Mesorhizobium sp. J428 TaxID=2898440 RepID=UPI0021519934|nr:hypothetical protein [Mesorhizobium sp. J428]MCR5858275.1 hypothetical protein [Mesorhizobium sp. J428]